MKFELLGTSVLASLFLLSALIMATESAKQVPANTANNYVPGLGEFMAAAQLRHAKLWFAGKKGNWPLAAYELDELKEAFDNATEFQPEFKGKPIAKLLEPMTNGPIAALEMSIKNKNHREFIKAYDQLSAACSACHRANGFEFIVIQRPTTPPLTNQNFSLAH